MENKLLPCPFCGGVPSLGCAGVCAKHSGQSTDYFVSCFSCGASTQRYFDTTGEAVAAWNRRVSPANPPLTLEQLREMDGEPVRVQRGKHGKWRVVKSIFDDYAYFTDSGPTGLSCADYGKTWLAYAHKPEKEDA